MSKPFRCSICSETITGQWGNNPWPYPGEQCCDGCDGSKVFPARRKWHRDIQMWGHEYGPWAMGGAQ
jgi:hypothetical protein